MIADAATHPIRIQAHSRSVGFQIPPDAGRLGAVRRSPRERHLSVLALSQGIDGRNNHILVLLDASPTGCPQDQNGDLTARQVLLVTQVLVGCHQQFKPRHFRRFEQLTVAQDLPPSLVGGLNNMMRQRISQRNRSAPIEENPNSVSLPARRLGKTRAGVFQDRFDLFAFYAGEPLEEILNAGAIFQILEERPDRHPAPPEDPSATDLLRRALHFRAL